MKKTIVFLLIVFLLTDLFVATLLLAESFPIKETLQPYIDNNELAGIVTVIGDKDKVLQLDAIGYANVDEKISMSGDTVFWIASQSKPITAAAVLMLVDEGKLDLDIPVTKYLPELKDLRVAVKEDENRTVLVPVAVPITLRHLLSHSSGMVWVPPLQQKHKIDLLPFSKALTTCVMTPLKSQPGTEHSYSNMGVNIAATVVERISGMLFEDFLEQRLFKPLGMKDTTFWPTLEQQKRLAEVYTQNNDTKTFQRVENGQLTYPLENRQIRYPEAAGGLYSTPNDLVKFYQMLLGEGEFHGVRILKPESVKEMWKKQPGHLPQHYGLCVGTGDGVFGHSGACGTDSKVDTNLHLVYLYFVQERGLTQSNKAKETFYKIVRENAK
ncbi:MAG: beta-lactamase family protein [Planctomycetaceae bacterium]|jgi:CubicO group peptidase (beta-lactamase class C family)|nr:beta-lactamase family protein [Planctomycetaceae bacterium]